MRNYKVIYLAVLITLTIGLQKAYSQSKLEVVVDTLQIEEAQVINAAITNVLDSAFTFLRRPILEFGTYYYYLSINKEKQPVVRPIFDINLFVHDYLYTDEESLDMFKRNYNLLLNYKDVQILVQYNVENNDTFALQFFRPTGNKIYFYHYHKISKSDPRFIFTPDNIYEQSVKFSIREERMTFYGYKLGIWKIGW